MFYTSTRNSAVRVTASKAITDGISPDGGLYIPTEIPKLTLNDLAALCGGSYQARAKKILGLYLSDFSKAEVDSCVDAAYADGKFASPSIAPVVPLHDGIYVLELFGGPTCAFKDMALQILPHLLTVSAAKNLNNKKIVILVATSGDTGKAALEGFHDVPGTKIIVFYPNDGVSAMQKLQMTTQEGENVGVAAIKGNFDDAQTGVKALFTDQAILQKLNENGYVFSSANSINWGRLAPQIVYYFSAYCDLVNQKVVKLGDPINITVPTGNFGNILAAFFAMQMGLPVKKLICASNANNVLTDFIKTGTYDRNRAFYTTVSPSMDILVSSNLERLLYLLSGGDSEQIKTWFGELKECGCYTVSPSVAKKISSAFEAGFCDDKATEKTIGETYQKYGYLCDTHTGVAVNVCEEYIAKSGDKTPTLVASTASPFKFTKTVLSAIGGSFSGDEFGAVKALEEKMGMKAPGQLLSLQNKNVRFDTVAEKADMAGVLFKMLGIE